MTINLKDVMMKKSNLSYKDFVKKHPGVDRTEYASDLILIFKFMMKNKTFLLNGIEGYKRAPLEGVVVKLENDFNDTFEKIKATPEFPSFKQAIGRMVAYIVKAHGYVPYGRCDIPAKLSRYFKRSSYYIKESERNRLKALRNEFVNQ